MPVQLDEHDPGLGLTPGTTKSDIVVFLYNHADLGFLPSEIADHLDVPDGTATGTLNRLMEAGYVGKTEDHYYHALDREDVRRYVAAHDELESMFEIGEKTPEADDSMDDVDDEAIETELAELEDDIDV